MFSRAKLAYMRDLIVIPEDVFEDIENALLKIRRKIVAAAATLEDVEPWKVKELIEQLTEASDMIVELHNSWDK